MNNNVIPCIEAEINCEDGKLGSKFVTGINMNQECVNFCPGLSGIFGYDPYYCGLVFKSSYSYFDCRFACYLNGGDTKIEGELKLNLPICEFMPIAIGGRFNTESYIDECYMNTRKESNVWVFSEFGQKVNEFYDFGFRFETTLCGSSYQRECAYIQEKIHNGIGCTLYFKNKTDKGDIVFSTRLGKLDKIDSLGEVDTVNLNNLKMTYN